MTKAPRASTPSKAEESRRIGHARSVSELLPNVGRAAFRRFGFVQSAVVSRWAEIVGERYARVSAPESLRFPHGERSQGVLTLTVAGAHGTMMQHIAPEIIERVNRFFGYPAVARVQFRQGEVARRKTPQTRSAPVRPTEADASPKELRAIADPELRAVLGALASSIEGQDVPKIGKVR
ncbi:DciA family protein [Stakelama sediminis]|uniref:DUF721 domain-containing protein n=1 Tax=Stakelama sediminis TaxID=463200 RepID=A0A840YX75_9SPHN|nr:DciA family protein [Stakelama sediminis]MBB5718149.1 hypothetical protein [Stakelama sediminis]